MKKTLLITASMLLLVSLFSPVAKAQEWSASLDIYSSYIWRGLKFGSGPAFQPGVEFSSGGFAVGGWGSVNSSTDEAFEADLYAGYTFDLSETATLGITLTDYYFGGDWTDFKATHYFEPMVNVGLGSLSLTGAYMFMPEGSYSANGDENTGDLYLEASYGFKDFSIGLGAGEGQYTWRENEDGTYEDGFGVCNINIGTSQEVKLTESYSLPVSGSVVLNPTTGGFYITVGISL